MTCAYLASLVQTQTHIHKATYPVAKLGCLFR